MAPVSVAMAEYRKKLRKLRKWHLLLCLIGMALSIYSTYVEMKLEEDPRYTALCDISPGISCTAVFGSEWGKGFGFMGKLFGDNSTLNQPNGVYGIAAYPLFILTSRFEFLLLAKASVFIAVSGILISGYLAFIMISYLSDMCAVCIAVYLVNNILLIVTVMYYRTMKKLVEEQSIVKDANASKVINKKRV